MTSAFGGQRSGALSQHCFKIPFESKDCPRIFNVLSHFSLDQEDPNIVQINRSAQTALPSKDHNQTVISKPNDVPKNVTSIM